MFSLESSYRGDFNEYTQNIIIYIKKETHPQSIQMLLRLQVWDFLFVGDSRTHSK